MTTKKLNTIIEIIYAMIDNKRNIASNTYDKELAKMLNIEAVELDCIKLLLTNNRYYNDMKRLYLEDK